MMQKKSKMFWLIVVPLIAAAIHLVLLIIALFPMLTSGKCRVTPPWEELLFNLLAWPYNILGAFNNHTIFWIGVVLSFLWAPTLALVVVKICMPSNRKHT